MDVDAGYLLRNHFSVVVNIACILPENEVLSITTHGNPLVITVTQQNVQSFSMTEILYSGSCGI